MLIFIDTETTGLESSDKICSIALVNDESYIYELINEGKKIPSSASAVHHLTNEMIKGAKSFKESRAYEFLQSNNNPENTLVAHNISFDIEKLALAGLIWQGDTIDTLRVTKHLIPECELFSLQNLRYELKLYKEEERIKNTYGITASTHTGYYMIRKPSFSFQYLLFGFNTYYYLEIPNHQGIWMRAHYRTEEIISIINP